MKRAIKNAPCEYVNVIARTVLFRPKRSPYIFEIAYHFVAQVIGLPPSSQ